MVNYFLEIQNKCFANQNCRKYTNTVFDILVLSAKNTLVCLCSVFFFIIITILLFDYYKNVWQLCDLDIVRVRPTAKIMY